MAVSTGTTTSSTDLWTARPNWSSSYRITYAFKTEVLTSRSGKEQRLALRRTPRRTFEYTATLQREDQRNAKTQVWGRQHLPLVVPDEPRFVRTAMDVALNDLVVPLAEIPDWLHVGAMLVLVGPDAAEMRSVVSIDNAARTVALLSPVSRDWPADTRVHYGVAGNLAASIASTRPTSKSGQMSVVFEATPTAAPFTAVPDTTFPMFDGAPVFLKKPNWAEAIGITSAHDVTLVDFDRGAVSRFLPVAFGSETRQAAYLGRTFDEVEAILKLFLRSRGRLKAFWAPTWEFDILPRAVVPLGLAAISVDGRDFAQAYGDSTVHKAVFVKFADGTVQYRRLIGIDETVATDGALTSTIALASAFGRAIDPDVDMVGWFYLNRFASDELTIDWVTRTVAKVQIGMVTVEVEPNLS